jgi:hypothetical protein
LVEPTEQLISCNLEGFFGVVASLGENRPTMAQPATEKNKLAQQKRDIARRARRLVLTQVVEADQARLAQFADELDKEAEALERLATSVSLPPPVAQVQQQQIQQQQSGELPAQPQVQKGKN